MEVFGIDLGALDPAAWWEGLPRLIQSVGVVGIGALVYYVVRAILRRVQRRWVSRTENRLDDHILHFVRQASLLSIVALTIMLLFLVWSAERPAAWTRAVWVGALFIPLGRFVGNALTELEERVIDKTETTLDDTALPLINKIIRFVIVASGVALTLAELGVNITPLLTGAGVMGLALSLAAKDTLSNLIAGVLLIIDRPFRVGDRIELWDAPNETGTWGDVIEIGLRATKIRNPDNLIVVVPNNEIMRRDIVNYTMSGEHIRLRIPFSVSYESDIERAKRVLIDIARETRGVKTDPEPVVIVRGFGPSEVNLQLRVWILEARDRRRIADEITGMAMSAFAEADVEIPYPKREIFLKTPGGAFGAAGPETADAAD
ncbi:MAG: mechanosensitive ion channel [Gemmatimonadota bacterium]|nr:mechanosensitive ion channel [Gemmatimonadota bacterium]